MKRQAKWKMTNSLLLKEYPITSIPKYPVTSYRSNLKLQGIIPRVDKRLGNRLHFLYVSGTSSKKQQN